MSVMEQVIPVTDLQRDASRVVTRVRETGDPVLVTQRGRSAAVLVQAEEYFRMVREAERLEELELREMVRQAEDDIAAGRVIPHEEVRARMQQRRERTS